MRTLVVTEPGIAVHIEGERLLLLRGVSLMQEVRLQEIRDVVLFGGVEVTSAAIAAFARRGIDVTFVTSHGEFRARLVARGSKNVALRLAQYRRTLEPDFALGVARAIVVGKVRHQRALLLRAQRRLHDEALGETLGRMRLLAERAAREGAMEQVRGLEGQAAALYFGEFAKMLIDQRLEFRGRSRRPPRDPVNACLSFGYTVLENIVETELLRVGLDPMLGFFHEVHFGRPSLALDLMEEFRPLVDGLVIRLVNRRQLGPADFERRSGKSLEQVLAESDDPREVEAPRPFEGEHGVEREGLPGEAPHDSKEGVFLSAVGRKILLTEFYRRMRERLWYPPREGAFELRDIIREQAYRLARVIQGEEEAYEAFVPQG